MDHNLAKYRLKRVNVKSKIISTRQGLMTCYKAGRMHKQHQQSDGNTTTESKHDNICLIVCAWLLSVCVCVCVRVWVSACVRG